MTDQPHRAALPAPRRAVTTVKNIPDNLPLSDESGQMGRPLSRALGSTQESGEREEKSVTADEKPVTRSIPRATKKPKESKR